MVINGVDSFVLYQNIKMGYTPSNATVLDLITLCEEAERLRPALQMLYDETVDYIKLNNLGDTHHNLSIQMARDALGHNVKLTGSAQRNTLPKE
ncbi:hypothetical protein UFOVP1155_53 [uncultured Caudovirales phage]|uniref:Uncharacterized protein n=1 Tax=uncultured Caudovirales phage TaxID=2100421 RepID=A0A6J5QSL4_9CAUD|nr:hypothetical protein UFOVP1155_53 [uncultured Caudovirales phage]